MSTLSLIKNLTKKSPAILALYKFIKAEGIKHAYFWTLKKKFKDSCG